MDRKDREREQLSTLLSNLYPNTISQDQMAKGFTRLLQFTEVRAHSNMYCFRSGAIEQAQICTAGKKELAQCHGHHGEHT